MGLNKTTEHILFLRMQEGDEDAFNILFNQYYQGLCTYAGVFVKYQDVAEDIVQDTFIRIWERRSFIAIKTTFKAYIYKSVHNNCINYIKNERYLSIKSESLRMELTKYAELNTINLDTKIIDNIISKEFTTQFNKALESLPPQCREVFHLCRNEKLSYSETAQKLGISVNTVKTQMKIALSKLNTILERHVK